jgi:uncharacterized repeat protein (TIGR03803 family)
VLTRVLGLGKRVDMGRCSRASVLSFLMLVIPTLGHAQNSALAATAQETVLHSFGGNDGAAPAVGVVAGANGALYGTSIFGGTAGNGTVFALVPGARGYKEKVLYSFSGGTDGSRPLGGLVLGKNSVLFGVTFVGGNAGWGVVFKLKPAKSGYKESVLYSFSGGSDGGNPVGNLIRRKDGTLIGVTTEGGVCGLCGTVFALAPSRSGYVETTLYSFRGGSDGYLPEAGLAVDRNGSIYGTTQWGGGGGGCGGGGCGTVVELVYANGSYTENTLHVFEGGSDGANPAGALTVDNKTGTIFGTTQYGGTGNDGGTVFMLVPSNCEYVETVLHSFTGTDGFGPMSQLLRVSGRFYGTTFGGGASDYGTVYELRHSQSGYAFKSIHNFAGPPDGSDPEQSALIMDSNGALYGTTRSGGTVTNCGDGGSSNGCGTVFQLLPQR